MSIESTHDFGRITLQDILDARLRIAAVVGVPPSSITCSLGGAPGERQISWTLTTSSLSAALAMNTQNGTDRKP